ncbi:MAG: sugar phosphate isomerase/epimerase family protein, partial [Chloroflexota bacterium]
ANPQKQANILNPLLEKYQLKVMDYFTQFGTAPALHSLNDMDETIRRRNMVLVRGAAEFCKLIGSPGMTILPGIDQVERSLEDNLNVSAEYLRQAIDIAAEFGIEVRFEPHMGSVADTPELALQLIEAVPRLKITLDYAHFILQYIPVERIHALIPHTGHMHVRQAKFGKLQVAHAEGIIDYPDVISRLKAVNYKGALTTEYVCADWFEVNRNDTLYETSVAREMLLPYIQ